MIRRLLLLTAAAVVAGASSAQAFDVALVQFAVDPITGDPTPTLRWSADGSHSAECRIDAQDAACVWGEYTPARPLADGVHTFAVRAIDLAGRRSEWSSVEFVVDTEAPTIAGLAYDARARRVTFTAAGHAKLECAADGAPLLACTSPFAVADGARVARVRARDEADSATVATLAPPRPAPAPAPAPAPVPAPAPASAPAPAPAPAPPVAEAPRYAPRPFIEAPAPRSAPARRKAKRRTTAKHRRCAVARKAERAKRRSATCRRRPVQPRRRRVA